MTKEEQKKFEELEKRIDAIEKLLNNDSMSDILNVRSGLTAPTITTFEDATSYAEAATSAINNLEQAIQNIVSKLSKLNSYFNIPFTRDTTNSSIEENSTIEAE